MSTPVKIHWTPSDPAAAAGASPDAEWFEPIVFPAAPLDRPWIYGVMVASQNGVVAWKRKEGEAHPVETILGGDPRRSERIADLLHMRHLRCFGDCSVGAETQRDQRGLIQTPREAWEDEAFPDLKPVSDALYLFRQARGLSRHPKNIRYSPSGRLDLSDPLFNTSGVEVIVVTTEEGAERLLAAGSDAKGIRLIVEPQDAAGLLRAHEHLTRAYGTRYLDCEGGETILRALRAADLLDEVFVTTTEVVVDPSAHQGTLMITDFEAEGAKLVAKGKISPSSAWVFRRWRFNRR